MTPTATTAPSAGTAAHEHDPHRWSRCGEAGVLDTHTSRVVDPIDLLHARQHSVPQAILDEYPPPRSLELRDRREAVCRLPIFVQRWAAFYAAEDALPTWERWAYVPHGNGVRARDGYAKHAPAVRRCVETIRAYLEGRATRKELERGAAAATDAAAEADHAGAEAAYDSAAWWAADSAADAAEAVHAAAEAAHAADRLAFLLRAAETVWWAANAGTEAGKRLAWLQQWWVRTLARFAFVLPTEPEDVR